MNITLLTAFKLGFGFAAGYGASRWLWRVLLDLCR